jgi:transposase
MALSLDLRERIVKGYEAGEGSIRKLAKRFKTAPATIFRILSRYNETGELKPKSPPGRPGKMNKKLLHTLSKIIKKNNDATFQELCEEFARRTAIKVSYGIMYRACEKLKITYKKNDISSGTKPT